MANGLTPLNQLIGNQPSIQQQTNQLRQGRRENELAQLLQPVRMRAAELQGQEQEQNRVGKASSIFLGVMGDTTGLSPEQLNERWRESKQVATAAGYDMSPLPDEYSDRWLSFAKTSAAQSGTTPQAKFQFGAGSVVRGGDGSLMFASQRRNPVTGEVETVTSPVSGQLVSSLGLTAQEKVGQVAAEAAAKKSAEAGVELETQPQIAAATTAAKEAAKNAAAVSEEDRSNAKALDVYKAGISGLNTALGNAETGVFVGLLPAMTNDARVAEGAISAMAPILKQLFRSAGEGTFTDSDQRLLMGMLPTRQDEDIVREAKLKMIDEIVMAKLGGSQAQQSASQTSLQQPQAAPVVQQPQVMTLPNGVQVRKVQ